MCGEDRRPPWRRLRVSDERKKITLTASATFIVGLFLRHSSQQESRVQIARLHVECSQLAFTRYIICVYRRV